VLAKRVSCLGAAGAMVDIQMKKIRQLIRSLVYIVDLGQNNNVNIRMEKFMVETGKNK
jgi:hypothetical protein